MMIRVVIRNYRLFYLLRKIPLLRLFIGFKMTAYNHQIPSNIQKEIFASFYVSDGTSRQTDPFRFDELERITLEMLDSTPDGPVLDIGASDGSTTLRFLDALRVYGSDRSVMVSDKYSRLLIIKNRIERICTKDRVMVVAYFGCLPGERSLPIFVLNR